MGCRSDYHRGNFTITLDSNIFLLYLFWLRIQFSFIWKNMASIFFSSKLKVTSLRMAFARSPSPKCSALCNELRSFFPSCRMPSIFTGLSWLDLYTSDWFPLWFMSMPGNKVEILITQFWVQCYSQVCINFYGYASEITLFSYIY